MASPYCAMESWGGGGGGRRRGSACTDTFAPSHTAMALKGAGEVAGRAELMICKP